MKSTPDLREKTLGVNDQIKNHSDRVEALKQALKGVKSMSDEMPLLRELTDEIRKLRELRERHFKSSSQMMS
jgi:hypothetical protein